LDVPVLALSVCVPGPVSLLAAMALVAPALSLPVWPWLPGSTSHTMAMMTANTTASAMIHVQS
jgi:hypothetical protein